MLRWEFPSFVQAKYIHLQNLREKKTIFNHYVRTWRGLKQKGQMQICFRVQKPCFTFIRWLTETLETLTKDRNVEEQRVEGPRLKFVIDRHQSLVPRIQVK